MKTTLTMLLCVLRQPRTVRYCALVLGSVVCVLVLSVLVPSALATPAEQHTLEFPAGELPRLEARQANARLYTWYLTADGAALSLTNLTPYMYYTLTTGASWVVTASCSVVSITGGSFNAVFTPAAFNTNGGFLYGVGVSDTNGNTTGLGGKLVLTADAFATGASVLSLSTNLNWLLYTWQNLPTWPFTDAPTNGNEYVRKDGAWSIATGGSDTNDLTNVLAGAGIEITGTGRSRTIASRVPTNTVDMGGQGATNQTYTTGGASLAVAGGIDWINRILYGSWSVVSGGGLNLSQADVLTLATNALAAGRPLLSDGAGRWYIGPTNIGSYAVYYGMPGGGYNVMSGGVWTAWSEIDPLFTSWTNTPSLLKALDMNSAPVSNVEAVLFSDGSMFRVSGSGAASYWTTPGATTAGDSYWGNVFAFGTNIMSYLLANFPLTAYARNAANQTNRTDSIVVSYDPNTIGTNGLLPLGYWWENSTITNIAAMAFTTNSASTNYFCTSASNNPGTVLTTNFAFTFSNLGFSSNGSFFVGAFSNRYLKVGGYNPANSNNVNNFQRTF